MCSELAEVGLERERCGDEQIRVQVPDARASADFLRRELLSSAERVVGLFVFALLSESLRGVYEERRLALGDG